MTNPQFPDPLNMREVERPGATASKAGPDLLQRVAALEQGALGRPGPEVSNGSVITSDTSQTGGVKWQRPAYTNLTYSGTWAAYSTAPFGNGAYAELRGGVVHLAGLVKRTGTSGTTIAVLPSGSRPASTLIFTVRCSAAMAGFGSNCRIDVDSSGNVVMNMTDPGTVIDWISLAGIVFVTA